MKLGRILALAAAGVVAAGESASVAGIQALAKRLFHGHETQFDFQLTHKNDNWSRWNVPKNDNYTVSSTNGKIQIKGTSLSALARGYGYGCICT